MSTETKTSSEIPIPPEEVENFIAHSRVYEALSHKDPWHSEAQRAAHLAQEHQRLAEIFVTQKIDSLSGGTSLSVEGVVAHGLLPPRLLRSLGITALGMEHHSQPYERGGVHVVPWSRAGETIRYAEQRVLPRARYGYVTPDNAIELAAMSPEAYEALPPSATRDHMLGIIEEARQFLDLDRADTSFYPLVYGIGSQAIPAETELVAVDSMIRGDVQVQGIIPAQAIKGIFAPDNQTENLRARLEACGRADIQLFSLEALRRLDQAEYGHMLPLKR